MENPVFAVEKLGQSIWYDNIRRGLITSGELQHMVEQDGLLGVTSNPSIFEKAVAGSTDYDAAIEALVAQGSLTAGEIYERLAVEDIQMAADVLRPVYERTDGVDGYVSMEVSPYIAHDTQATVDEARRLRQTIDRENVMIKVPSTAAGIPAVRQLISDGININATLLFAVESYEAVANAYIEGLEERARRGGDLGKVASVASFFMSRIDSLVDQKLEEALDNTQDEERRTRLKLLIGKMAIASGKVAYARYQKIYAEPRWQRLQEKGARPQRVLWASTSTKNPKYSPTLYVDELIGPGTVNTVPTETWQAFRKQGRVRAALTENQAAQLEQAKQDLETLGRVCIPIKDVTDRLLTEGVQKFSDAFDQLLAAIEKKRQARLAGALARQSYALAKGEERVQAAFDEWRAGGKVRRLWNADAKLWTGADEDRWLGWLHVVEGQRDHLDQLRRVVEEVGAAGFRHALLLGMGGSSLCPEVLKRTFGAIEGSPELFVLDSTVPAQVDAYASKIELAKTLFIVSSKSGGTSEPNAFKQYFFDRIANNGSQFVAITDPGTALHKLAKADGFRHIVHGIPSIGGRYSAMSNFGLVPAGIMGLDVSEFLARTEIMVQSCAAFVPPDVNPGVALGIIMGTLAKQGRDKLTLIASPAISALGAWLEQLIAESTGKHGKGIVPVDGERAAPPEVYGNDRVFVYLRLETHAVREQDDAVDALESAGHPVIRIRVEDRKDLGQEFFRWEIATAVAGSVLGINPFDQPDVEASKVATRSLTAAYEQSGKLPKESPLLQEAGLSLYTDAANAEAIGEAASARSLAAFLKAHLQRLQANDYFAINAYVEMSPENEWPLQTIRHAVRDRLRVATTLGYGPRFLHSTGQLHKGGPNNGVFLQITADDAEDLAIPGQKYSFGILKRFQAQGDFEVLAERKRRVLRVHLGPDVQAGLKQLQEILKD